MLFNSYPFIFIFLPITLIGYFFLGKFSRQASILWLALASLLFYGYWSLYSLPILFISICLNYFFGTTLIKIDTSKKSTLLFIAIMCNLLILGYFKYSNFFILNINLVLSHFTIEKIILNEITMPIGISFFTFTQLTFLMQCFKDQISKEEKNFSSYVLFVSFFPHLVAGPILYYKKMIPQFLDPNINKININKISIGLLIFIIGLSKKLLIADSLGSYVDYFYNSVSNGVQPGFVESWISSLAYTFQIYFDFSGYSDMAVGLSLLFGIVLPFNFNSPFKSLNILDFWKRWHITLTKLITEYLYTPLTLSLVRYSLNRALLIQTICSLILPTLITFIIIGFWHGANWNFVLFGLMHGLLIIINHIWRNSNLFHLKPIFSWVITFISVNFSFVIFRSENIPIAKKIITTMLGVNEIQWNGIDLRVILMLLISFFIVLGTPNTLEYFKNFELKTKIFYKQNAVYANKVFPIIIGIFLFTCLLKLGSPSPFLYFQF